MVFYAMLYCQEIETCKAEFYIAGTDSKMRMGYYSCNGFSLGIDDVYLTLGVDLKIWKFETLWNDLLNRHYQNPYFVLIGGGDQIYCDALFKESEHVKAV